MKRAGGLTAEELRHLADGMRARAKVAEKAGRAAQAAAFRRQADAFEERAARAVAPSKKR